ncbi:MAG: ABC transporter substrate-binding protein [Pseudomonadota bacterium]
MRTHLIHKALRTALLSLLLAMAAVPSMAQAEGDLLSIGGSVTEIVYRLGQEHRLLARDTTSTYPEEAEALPDVGYMRALSAEGVLSVNPQLIISEDGAGPQETIDILEAANIRFVKIPDSFSPEGVTEKILAVGEALGVSAEAEALAREVNETLTESIRAAEAMAASAGRKRVLFVLSTRGGRILASGTNTAADSIITMAGGVNAATGFEGYKPVSDEAVTAAAPDVVLMMQTSATAHDANEQLFSIPALLATPAGRDRAVVRINGLLLLGFGPRTAEAVAALSKALYGEG